MAAIAPVLPAARPLVGGCLDPRTPHFGKVLDEEEEAIRLDESFVSTAANSEAAESSDEESFVAEESPLKRAGPPQPASAGSLLHSVGGCEPCAWFWKPQGCRHGAACLRCHLCPEGEIKARKATKLAARRRLERLPQSQEEPATVALEPALQELEDASLALLRCLGPPPGLQPPPLQPLAVAPVAADAVPAPPTEPAPPSLGSLRHQAGACEPCAWFWKPQGCQNGAGCSRCHLCPPGEVKARKSQKRDALRQQR